MIAQAIIDQVLDRTDIVEVIAGYIQLKKAGASFKANCPFHSEKTPSFVVSPDKQIYHCFGCGAGGNVVGFVMKYENMEFPEALRMLADKAGIEIPRNERQNPQESSMASRLLEMNKFAAAFYQDALKSEKGKKALEYLKQRGFSSDALSEFKVGYAFNEWESLRKYCQSKKVPADLLRKAGLTIPSEKGKGDYDRFRNRIIFPVFNEKGNVVAFGGRVLDDSLPKYINSPETVIYSKSNILYGLNFSKRSIHQKGYAIIVEGYMDVIIPFQHGITNVVATSGTALTARQVSLLKRQAKSAVMVFDSDKAGEAASLRGLDILVANGMNVKIVTLPEGSDPDSFVRKKGKEAFEQEIAAAKDLFDYKLELLIEKLGSKDIGSIVDEMLPTISRVEHAVVQSDYLKRLAEQLGIHEASLRYELGKVKPDYSYSYEAEAQVSKDPAGYRMSEVHLLGLAIVDRKIFDEIRGELGLDKFQDINVRKSMDIISDLYEKEETGEINPGKLLGRMEKDEGAKNAVMHALAKADITEDTDKALQDCIFCVRKENRDELLKDLTLRLKKAQESNDNAEMKDLLVKINNIYKERVA